MNIKYLVIMVSMIFSFDLSARYYIDVKPSIDIPAFYSYSNSNIGINIPLSVFFISTCGLIDADIKATRYGLDANYLSYEANPIAKFLIDNSGYENLRSAAYLANFATFNLVGLAGKAIAGQKLSDGWQYLYTAIITIVEMYAISTWSGNMTNEVRIQPLYVIF